MDPRTPVLVGAGQLTRHLETIDDAVEPLALIEEAVRGAAADTGRDVLSHLDLITVVNGMWEYPDPGRLIADRVGSPDAASLLTESGGNVPQQVVAHHAAAISRGELDAVVVCGGEALHTRRTLRAAGRDHTYRGLDVAPASRWGTPLDMTSDHERSRGVFLPIRVYPLFECARRHARALDHPSHRRELGQLWAGFNAVAVANPHAWSRTPMTAEEIATPSPSNRMVGFPYTKAMNANMTVDQAAALVVCSAGWAEARGIARDRWVFPWAASHASDTDHVSNRIDLCSSPAIRLAGRQALDLAGVGIDEVGPLDLYSCFPAVVQITCDELGIDPSRQLTLTGGLPLGGGPGNNYSTHGIAQMVGTLRELSGDVGLVHANGGLVTKHAVGVYGTEPPGDGFRSQSVQAAVDAAGSRAAAPPDHAGPVTIEAYTVMHDRTGPTDALVACLTGDGERAWGTSTEPDLMAELMADDLCEAPAILAADGVLDLAP